MYGLGNKAIFRVRGDPTTSATISINNDGDLVFDPPLETLTSVSAVTVDAPTVNVGATEASTVNIGTSAKTQTVNIGSGTGNTTDRKSVV